MMLQYPLCGRQDLTDFSNILRNMDTQCQTLTRESIIIEGNVLFPTQIVVTRELDEESHIWLKALSERLGKDDMRNLLEGVNKLTEKMDKELADSV